MTLATSVRLLQTQSDDRLALLAASGHERAFEALVRRYRGELLAHCRRMQLPPQAADDAVQQGLMQAWIALRRGTEVRDVRAWLHRIVHNAALLVLRARDEHAELSESLTSAATPETHLELQSDLRETLAAIASLPDQQREALVGIAANGMSQRQVASLLGVSPPAVRGLVYRARVGLRKAVTAVTPLPLVTFAATGRGTDVSLSGHVAELAGGTGGLGVAGALAKGGAVGVAAIVFTVGVTAVHHQVDNRSHHATSSNRTTVPASNSAPTGTARDLVTLRLVSPTHPGTGSGSAVAAGKRAPSSVAASPVNAAVGPATGNTEPANAWQAPTPTAAARAGAGSGSESAAAAAPSDGAAPAAVAPAGTTTSDASTPSPTSTAQPNQPPEVSTMDLAATAPGDSTATTDSPEQP